MSLSTFDRDCLTALAAGIIECDPDPVDEYKDLLALFLKACREQLGEEYPENATECAEVFELEYYADADEEEAAL